MNWRTVWTTRAVAGLTSAYLDLATRGLDAAAVARTSAELDRRFATNPAELGESRAGIERVTFEPPLVAFFEVHEEERVVVVTTVRWTDRT
jgi:plasmid stabilization system protein ParE